LGGAQSVLIREMQPVLAFSHLNHVEGCVRVSPVPPSTNEHYSPKIKIVRGIQAFDKDFNNLLEANMNALRCRIKLISIALPYVLIWITGCGSSSTTTSTTPKSLSSISITPSNPSIAVNATEQFTATGNYSDGSTTNLSSSATWASSNQSIATVSEAGVGKGAAAGSTAITATMSGVTGSTTLTVTAAAVTVTSIAVSPATASITTGATQQFTATATYSNGSTGNVTASATWASSNATAATVNSAGLATGSSAGSATISATVSGTSGSATLTVVAPTLTSITVTPSDPSFTDGATEQFAATANYSNNTTANVASSATWSSSNAAVATISSSGVATGQGGGTTTISAALSGKTGSTTASVTLSGTTSITTWHVDTNRSGLNNQEATLTPANVNASNFGKLFSCPVDGYVYGTPLILSNQTINGARHNVLYSSTTNSGDMPGYGIKFTSPVVANGKVYISTGPDLTTVSNPRGEIDVYGLK